MILSIVNAARIGLNLAPRSTESGRQEALRKRQTVSARTLFGITSITMKMTNQHAGSHCLYSYNVGIVFACMAGVLLSAYAYHVEVSAQHDNDYSAMCDISEHVSCSKVFTSEYGRGFGVIGKIFGEDSPMNLPNGCLGTIFYAFLGLMSLSNNLNLGRLQLVLSAVSLVLSMRLAYILIFILNDFCVVCVSTYVVNVVNSIFAYLKVREIKKLSTTKKARKMQ